MSKSIVKRARFVGLTIMYALGATYLMFTPQSAHAATPNGDTLNTHAVMVDNTNKIVSWVSDQDKAYAEVSKLSWEYLLNMPNQPNGKPAFYSHSYQDPNTEKPVTWPHNPAGLYSMLIESAVRYYQYSGDSRVLTLAQQVADHQLANGMTAASDSWSSVPYASGNDDSLTYNGSKVGDASGGNEASGVGDGTGVIEPDKVAEFSRGLVSLYKVTGKQAYLDAAVQGANQLVSHVRTGNANQSPWPFRVVAANNSVKEQYSSNVAPVFELFDELIALNTGNVSGYQTTRTAVWNWMMAYPIQNNYWSGYFEDVPFKTTPYANLNQLNAMMVARYLLENPQTDPNWEAHVRGLIAWVEQTFGQDYAGAKMIKEQETFFYTMGSHTSRYASINALLYEKTGDTVAKEKAYRAYNWATYMARTNGVVIDGPQVNNQWYTDGHGDYVRHFMVGLGAVPAWAPNGQTHIVDSSSVVTSVSYANPNLVSYQTFNNDGVEKIKVDRAPASITVNGTAIAQRSDLNAQGWVYNATDSTVSIRRDNGKNVVMTLSGSPANQAPTVSLTSPTNNANFQTPATIQVSANAVDPEGNLEKVEFYQNGTLVATDTATPFAATLNNVSSGSYTYTAKAYDTSGAVGTSATSVVTVGAQAVGWTNADVGSVGVAGSATVNNGTHTVKGSGVDIWGTADSFNFQYVPLSGDGEVKARVASLQNTDPWALAGVMIRENLTASSRHMLAAVTPTNGLALDYRSSAGGNTTYIKGGSGAAPYWLRVVRSGSTLTAYKSTNGTSWTSIGSTTIALGATAYAGLAVTSHQNSTLATATFDNVFVTGQSGGDTTAPVISNVAAGAVNVNGGTISWNTNEPSTSQIEYGTTTAYGSNSPLNSSMETSHAQVVSGLQPGTLYHYRVKSTDAAGNTAVSGDNTFTTQAVNDTTAPSVPTNVAAQALSSTSARVTWSASSDNTAVTGYTVLRDDAAVGTTTSALTFTETGLTPGASYTYKVIAKDAAGNESDASAAAIVTLPTLDTTAPAVSLTAPTAGASVNGTVAVSANASDNVGVSGVQFKLDGANLSSEDTTDPYTVSWNTTGVANGSHTLSAVARDAAGNATTASTVTVNVQNTTSSNLVAAYNFNDASGTTLSDKSGKNHPGTLTGATWSTSGKNGGALSFNGTSNYVTVADANDLDLTNALTLEAWIKPTSTSGWRTVLMKEGASNALSYSLYAGNNANKAAFVGRFGTTEPGVSGTANLSTTAWTHLTATFDGTTMRLYVNGTLNASRAQSGSFVTSSGALRIGGNTQWGEYYSGLIDDIRIYNKVLNQTEIQADMNTAVQ